MIRSAISLLPLLLAACMPNLNGPSSPDEDPFARLRNHTAIVAYEFGACVTDADCVPQGCDNAVCSPAGDEGTCVSSGIGLCLAQLPRETCGCYEGVCEWARTPEVNLCAQLAWQKPMNRTFQSDAPGVYYEPRFVPSTGATQP